MTQEKKGCSRHRSDRLHWLAYDALPLPTKRAFQNATYDWCVRCFVEYPWLSIQEQIDYEDEAAMHAQAEAITRGD